MTKRHTGICNRIRELASRPEGVALNEVPGFTSLQVWRNAWYIRDSLHYVGERLLRRYFTSLDDAMRYEAQLPALRAQREQDKKARKKVREQKRRAKEAAARQAKAAVTPKQPKPKPEPAKPVSPHWRKDPPVTIPRYTGQKWDKDKPADYSRAKLTVYPSHPGYDMRYSLPPGAKVEGEFSRIPLGATLEAA